MHTPGPTFLKRIFGAFDCIVQPCSEETMHTPGPWHVTDCRNQKNGQIRIFADSGAYIANVLARNPSCEVDARLIAEAPAMLESLKDLFKHCAMVHKHWGDENNTEEADRAVKFAEAVIARAEGREP